MKISCKNSRASLRLPVNGLDYELEAIGKLLGDSWDFLLVGNLLITTLAQLVEIFELFLGYLEIAAGVHLFYFFHVFGLYCRRIFSRWIDTKSKC